VLSATNGATTLSFDHDSGHQRFRQRTPTGAVLYFADAASGAASEVTANTGSYAIWTDYLMAGGQVIGMRVSGGSTPAFTHYFHKDNLGSIATITNEAGAIVERLSYDPWGKRRNANGTDDTTNSVSSEQRHGFTGHEELDLVSLVHMNGRVYDPIIGRFTSADPTTENPLSSQGWNRYSYVGNSPLNFTDPSGYCCSEICARRRARTGAASGSRSSRRSRS